MNGCLENFLLRPISLQMYEHFQNSLALKKAVHEYCLPVIYPTVSAKFLCEWSNGQNWLFFKKNVTSDKILVKNVSHFNNVFPTENQAFLMIHWYSKRYKVI